jgi:hypothetical protein
MIFLGHYRQKQKIYVLRIVEDCESIAPEWPWPLLQRSSRTRQCSSAAQEHWFCRQPTWRNEATRAMVCAQVEEQQPWCLQTIGH